jgi:uncharacterized protein (TIGR02594 family)
MLPKQFQWLLKEGAPKLLMFALKLYGITETPGAANNPEILRWAKLCKIRDYVKDATPWCGLFVAYVVLSTGWKVVDWPLGAINWAKFGVPVQVAMLGDILVFKRPGGNHVGIYVGEDHLYYYVLGGNQGDKVCILRIAKSRCIAKRRPPYTIQPANVRRIFLKDGAPVSANEA